jgi:hypothetical protein
MGGKLLRTMGGRGRQITEVAWVKHPDEPLAILARTVLTDRKDHNIDAKLLTKDFFQYAFNLEAPELAPVPAGPYRLRQYATKDVNLVWNGARLHVERDGKRVRTIHPDANDPEFITGAAVTLLTSDRVALAKGRTLHLYDTHSGERLGYLLGTNGVTHSAAPSPDNRYLLAGGDDQVLRIWSGDSNVKPALPLLSVFVAGPDWVAWTRQGY